MADGDISIVRDIYTRLDDGTEIPLGTIDIPIRLELAELADGEGHTVVVLLGHAADPLPSGTVRVEGGDSDG